MSSVRELTDREMEVWERLRAVDEVQEDADLSFEERRDQIAVMWPEVIAAFDRLRARPDTTSEAEGGEESIRRGSTEEPDLCDQCGFPIDPSEDEQSPFPHICDDSRGPQMTNPFQYVHPASGEPAARRDYTYVFASKGALKPGGEQVKKNRNIHWIPNCSMDGYRIQRTEVKPPLCAFVMTYPEMVQFVEGHGPYMRWGMCKSCTPRDVECEDCGLPLNHDHHGKAPKQQWAPESFFSYVHWPVLREHGQEG